MSASAGTKETPGTGGVARAAALSALGLVYLALVAATFLFSADLENDAALQAALHVTVIASAVAYTLFADGVYGAHRGDGNARLALVFAALFTVPVLVGRGVGLAAVAFPEIGSVRVLNFYAPASASRAAELVAWTSLFPLSMLFLARLCLGEGKKALALVSLLSSVFCFAAFPCLLSAQAVFLYLGLLGWGPLFLLVAVLALFGELRARRRRRQGAERPETAA